MNAKMTLDVRLTADSCTYYSRRDWTVATFVSIGVHCTCGRFCTVSDRDYCHCRNFWTTKSTLYLHRRCTIRRGFAFVVIQPGIWGERLVSLASMLPLHVSLPILISFVPHFYYLGPFSFHIPLINAPIFVPLQCSSDSGKHVWRNKYTP